jgi:hypothetical protein
LTTAIQSPAKKVAARKRKPVARKTDDVLLTILLDRSGSMGMIRDATIKGFNDFVSSQRDSQQKGKLLVSLVQFDTEYEPNFAGVDVAESDIELDYSSFVPRGGTALLDSLAHAIHDTDAWIKDNAFKGRIIFLVITDGEENSSSEYTHKAITKLVSEYEVGRNWSFAYVGANVDAFGNSVHLGMQQGSALQTASNPQSVSVMFAATGAAMENYRQSGASGQVASGSFYDNDMTDAVLTSSADVNTYVAGAIQSVGTVQPKKKK